VLSHPNLKDHTSFALVIYKNYLYNGKICSLITIFAFSGIMDSQFILSFN
jgi:hypothetical protein